MFVVQSQGLLEKARRSSGWQMAVVFESGVGIIAQPDVLLSGLVGLCYTFDALVLLKEI
jgi:hypothetical protein